MTNHTSHASELLHNLGEVISKINTFSTVEALLSYLQESLKLTLNTNSVWLYTVRPDDPMKLDLQSISGSATQQTYQNISTVDATNDAMLRSVLASEQSVFVPNAMEDPRTDKYLVKLAGINSLLACRIIVDRKTLGVFGTGTHFSEGYIDISPDQLAFFTAVTKAVGICLDKLASDKKSQLDALTHVYNRHGLHVMANTLFSLGERHFRKVGVLYFDLDDFKIINDTFGHHIGDKALTMFASYLTSSVRESDVVARIGGDEFVVVLNDVKSQRDIHQVLDNIQLKANALLVEETQMPLSYSVGFSVFPDHGNSLDALLQSADMAMYHSKVNSKVEPIL